MLKNSEDRGLREDLAIATSRSFCLFARSEQLGRCDMSDATYLTALAALAGSTIGGLTSLASAWLTQRHQDRAKQILQDKGRRQSLYKQFIIEASKLYADALTHDKSDISALVNVYSLIGQMRILSSVGVVGRAEVVTRTIVDTFFAPNKTFLEFRELVQSRTVDLLRPFTDECRAELQALPNSKAVSLP
jgi:hypothetical protein